MRGKQLSDDIVLLIYKQKDNGLSYRQISENLQVSVRAIYNAIKRRGANTNIQDKKKKGRPRISSKKMDAYIKLVIKRNRFAFFTVKFIKKHYFWSS